MHHSVLKSATAAAYRILHHVVSSIPATAATPTYLQQERIHRNKGKETKDEQKLIRKG